jgi:hypothetical protein
MGTTIGIVVAALVRFGWLITHSGRGSNSLQALISRVTGNLKSPGR